jgi:L,D-transpeptidase catalytic domain
MCQLKRWGLGARVLAIMAGPVIVAVATPAFAQGDVRSSRTAEAPLMAVVALNSQRVTVYSAVGKMLEAPVSTGQTGYDTPAGIYSVIEKHRDHYSNLYDDAAMPFMQRLTWSGIALHGGTLPGYPASHGCIRLPHDFAGRLFDLTRMGMRVVVVRDDTSPVDFAHPALFRPSVAGGRSLAAAKAAAAEAASTKAEEARRIAAKARREAAEFEEGLELATDAKKRAEDEIEEADRLIKIERSSALARELKEITAKAQVRLARAQAEIDAIYAKGKAKIDAASAARAEAKAAQAASVAARNEAKAAAVQPVSVFISRKTQRLYVRKAFEPLFESDVTIHNATAPIGTTIFTVLDYAAEGDGLRWSALAMYPGSHGNRGAGSARTNAEAAKAALERISIPQDAIDRIDELISPGSSLIISDEGMSRETSKGTDFVVLMSGEPQGGIRRRPRNSYLARGYDYGPYAPGGGGLGFLPWW